MRRKTLKVGIDLSNNAAKTIKKYSYQSKTKMASAGQLYPHYIVNYDTAYSQVVVKTLLQDLLESLEPTFLKVDERKYFTNIMQKNLNMENQLTFMLDPMSQDSKIKVVKPFIEKEPPTAATQLYCGGKTQLYDYKLLATKRSSIIGQVCKNELKQIISSKKQIVSSVSSKCLLRLPKEQSLQRKRSMEALKLQSLQINDRYDELIKEKVFKQNVLNLTTCLFKPKVENLDKTNSKFNANLTTIEEYSYDYDGSAIPIKKFSRAFPDKVKILNPIYKVAQKNSFEMRKIRNSRYDFLQSYKVQADEIKLKVQNAQVHQLNLGRKSSTRQFINQLSLNENKQELDLKWKRTFQELTKAKAIRIRQLKQI